MTEAGLSRFALLHWRVSGDWVVGMVVVVVGRVHGRVAHHHCINRQSRLYGLGKDVRTLHSYLQSASLTQSIVYTVGLHVLQHTAGTTDLRLHPCRSHLT